MQHGLEPPWESIRTQLVRLCVQLVGNREVAEELAHETLIVAWQQGHRLRHPERLGPWMAGIARNLCKHWRRRQRLESAHHVRPSGNSFFATHSDAIEDTSFDLELELDRHELAVLLDRALALLPALTRTILIERYISESPQAEIAERLGITVGAVEARLHRGKLALRRVLSTDLQAEASWLGLIDQSAVGGQETRIWCPGCGKRRLSGSFRTDGEPSLHLWCSCGLNAGMDNVPGLFDGIHGFRAALSRVARWHHPFFQSGLKHGQVECPHCGANILLQRAHCLDSSASEAPFVWAHCTRCNWMRQADLTFLALYLPEVQKFWREHPRVAVVPPTSIAEAAGVPALVTGFRDVSGGAQIDIVFAHALLTPLDIQQA